jgi:hypothetical protein
MRSSYQDYRERHGIEVGKPKKFYIVACPICLAPVGKSCHYINNSAKYALPHSKRIKDAKEKMNETSD